MKYPVQYAASIPPEEFIRKIQDYRDRGWEIRESYDFDRNRIRIAVITETTSNLQEIFFSKPFYILEHGEYLEFKEKLSTLLPEEFAKTGHMW